MGRKKRGGGKHNAGGRVRRGGGGADRADSWHSYPDVAKENKGLEGYYNTLLDLPEGEQRDEFWSTFRRELPNSFRFAGSKGHAIAVKKLLQDRYIPEITKISHLDGQPVSPPQAVPWYPDNLAWWMTTPKHVIRKFPPFAAFQKFLVSETTVGNISRQEVVSMIPPLLMDVRPGMSVLDLCAAPGSKAAQLLEMIHNGEEARIRKVLRTFASEDGLEMPEVTEAEATVDLEADATDAGRATGLLIANDSDYKRSHLLIHQLKRLSSPNLIVTNHDATMYPALRLPSDDPKKAKYLKFDRILADVPCSGDGTLRKNVNLWKDWQPGTALGLHLTQVRILVRALQMLKVGGRVVYSTCSLNPVENESVVAAAIERCGGPDAIEILDSSNELPGLKRSPGLKDWKIIDKSQRIWSSWAQVEEHTRATEDKVIPSRLVDSMFPKPAGTGPEIPLERCMRIYPHLQDTGGFFIVALHKKKEFKTTPEETRKTVLDDANSTVPANGDASTPVVSMDVDSEATKTLVTSEEPSLKRSLEEDEVPAEPEAKKTKVEEASATATPDVPSLDEEAATETEQPAPADGEAAFEPKTEAGHKTKQQGAYEDPFKFISPDHPIVQRIREFYRLSPRFPSDRYMVRNEMGEPLKAIYYTAALARDILASNEGKGVKFIHGGVKMFVKQDAPSAEICPWRIQSEGVPILQGYVGAERVVHLHKKETLRQLLVEMFPKLDGEGAADLAEIEERIRTMGMGCCVLRVEPKTGADGADDEALEPMALPLWKSFHSLNLMLPKEDRAAMLLRIFNDTTPLINNSLLKKQKEREAENGGSASADNQKVLSNEAIDAIMQNIVAEHQSGADVTKKAGQGEEAGVEANGEGETNANANADAVLSMYDIEDAPSE